MLLSRVISGFRRDEQGATAVMFGVALVPLMVAIGASADYARMADYRTQMQAGVDAAAIAMAKEAANATNAQLTTRGRPFYNLSAPDRDGFATSGFSATRSGKTIAVQATGNVQLVFGGFLGMGSADITAQSQVTSGAKKVELALVLDNTGSMAQASKLVELKKAVINLMDKMQTINDASPDTVKIALVPFTTQVNIGKSYSNAAWLRYHDNGTAGSAADKASWNGCVMDRDQPQNINDTSPISTDYHYWHPIAYQGKSPAPRYNDWNGPCQTLQPIMQLTSDLKSTGAGSMRYAINNMKANGNTNVSIGVAWGLKALMNRAPFAGAAAPGDADVIKAMIVLTDGDNTEDRWSGFQSDIDSRTSATCATAKNAVKNANGSASADSYIKIYTIRVIDGNRTLLQSCAANGGTYSEVSQASQLNDVFQSIADQITRIRLTS
ncbi:TadE/TadG family type IV pilus assembly protein [Terrarubrum flagellatum]|uniref:TadE/TadG family type IV pilus assembly protein n=1 Tax=Terrirubrum flagellatum TaxID=2895980 RepID=UPI00314569EA